MYLKRIEISGFKSFANKTVLNLEKGITAIVGPNGSGKSNIADAIKWVLGEQSAKLLRGKKSEDVIFAGSEKKAQVSAASVFLTFDNRSKRIPLDFEEVVAGRRIFRDGTGQYFLNGSKARLSDIADNLSVSGAGKGDYSIISQGMTDKILSSTPLERRFMMEESSGIKQFRLKRDQAERKLEATSQNISRISDLLSEIEPRLKFLRKQAAKAEKREELEKQLKENQKKYYSSKINSLKKEKNIFDIRSGEVEEKIKKAKIELFELEESLKKESEKESFGQEKIIEIRKKIQHLSFARRDIEKEIAILEGKSDLLKRQISDKQAKVKSFENEIDKENKFQINKREKSEEEKIFVRKKDIESVLDLLESAQNKPLPELPNAIGEILNVLKKAVKIEKKENTMLDFAETRLIARQIDLLKSEMRSDGDIVKKNEAELLEKRSSLEKIEKEIDRNEAEIIQINQEDQKRRSGFFILEKESRMKRDCLDELRSKEISIKIEASRIIVHLEDIEKEIRDEIGADFNPAPVQAGENIFLLEAEIKKIKVQLDQIGGIDGLMLEERNEAENRFSSMSKEFEDLENTKKNLKELVLDLDRKMEKKFSESFNAAANEFEKYFKMLFKGGSAKIFYSKIKENPEEKEDAEKESFDNFGIEIEAVPPGKKTRNLAMLSGGERALTSIALLFAIIASNHPPFCVLDEVDAALDEANSSKIGQVFKELSEKTQFIIITHNRGIMSQAAALYGVTMQKDGVSHLLSVKLEKVF